MDSTKNLETEVIPRVQLERLRLPFFKNHSPDRSFDVYVFESVVIQGSSGTRTP